MLFVGLWAFWICCLVFVLILANYQPLSLEIFYLLLSVFFWYSCYVCYAFCNCSVLLGCSVSFQNCFFSVCFSAWEVSIDVSSSWLIGMVLRGGERGTFCSLVIRSQSFIEPIPLVCDLHRCLVYWWAHQSILHFYYSMFDFSH